MAQLVKNIDEIRKFIPVNTGSNIKSIDPYLDTVEEDYIIDLLSEEEFDDLVEAYKGDSLSEQQKALLKHLQRAMANLAYLQGIDILDIRITDNGFHVAKGENFVPASQYRMENFRRNIAEAGYKALDRALSYLVKHENNFPEWKASANRKSHLQYIINTTKEFNNHFDIKKQASVFHRLRPAMLQVKKFSLEPVLGRELLNQISTQAMEGNVSEPNQKLLELVNPALANLTILRAVANLSIDLSSLGISERSKSQHNNTELQNPARNEVVSHMVNEARSNGHTFLKLLKDFLDEKHTDYPLYPYVDPLEEDESLNSQDSHSFMF